jgi:hypothetical protein
MLSVRLQKAEGGLGMARLLRLKSRWVLALFVFLNTICVGMGMGVPIFCILFGFLVGWYVVRRLIVAGADLPRMLNRILFYAVVTSAYTFVVMAALWGPTAKMLFDPAADLANFGIPLILYDPRASSIGWLALMIAISPFLQLLTTLFGSYLTLLLWLRQSTPLA